MLSDIDFNSRSAELLKVLNLHTDHVLSMSLLQDNTLVTSSKDRTLKFWDMENFKLKYSKNLNTPELNAIETISSGPLNGQLAIACDNLIKIFNPKSGEIEMTLPGHTKTINTLLSLPNGNLVSAGQDKVIKMWNTKTGIHK